MDVEGSLWNHEAYVSEWFSKVSVIIKVRLGLIYKFVRAIFV